MTEAKVAVVAAVQKPSYPWRLFFLLFAGAVLSVLAVLPYVTTMLGTAALTSHPLPLPLPVLALIQGTINFTLATGLGLLAARQLGLGAPILESWLYRNRPAPQRPILLVASTTGIIMAVIAVLMVMTPMGEPLRHFAPIPESALPLWKRLLACLYGGLGEEVLMRLFLLSVVLWSLVKVFRAGPRSTPLFWISNFTVAIAFGAAHLPFAASLGALTPALATTIIGLNAFFGLGFGYLYWSRGLEAAMIGHFSADIILHILGPMFVKG